MEPTIATTSLLPMLLDILLHLDQHLIIWFQDFGPWLYVILFLIVFAETGLIATPFLPGDSLLFALGAMTSWGNQGLSLAVLSLLLVAAAFLGDNVNYRVGRFLGPKVFNRENSFFLNKNHLSKTREFYDSHGVKAVVLARFVPIVRTFVPFIAGVAQMRMKTYLLFSLIGAVLWTQIFLWAGHIFGNLPSIKRNFHIVILAVILISLMPMVIAWLRSRMARPIPNKSTL